MDYYYTDASNQTRGPVSLAELQQLAATGQVTPATMVAAVGSQQWVSIATVLPNVGAAGVPTGAPGPVAAAPGVAVAPGMPVAPTEPLAMWSMILGIASLTICCMAGFLVGPAAVVCGHMAQSSLKKNPQLQGRGMAIAGLVMGYIATVGSILYMLIWGGALVVQLLSGQH